VKVLVSGSSGFIGRALLPALEAAGHTPVRLVRGPAASPDQVSWDVGAGRLDPAELAGIGGVVHLAGAGIGEHRWRDEYKREIRESRTAGTGLLARALAAMATRPAVLVSASAVGYYGDRGDEVLTEASPAGDGFLAEVSQAWEAATGPASEAGIRTVLVRSGLVLSAGGGTLGRLLPVFRLGVGGRVGSGRQWWSWISLEDEVAAILHALDHEELRGPANLTAPHPLTNAAFTKVVGAALHRPTVVPVPGRAIGLVLGREMARELVLGSQRAVPAALQRNGFVFRHPTLPEAMPAILGPATPRKR